MTSYQFVVWSTDQTISRESLNTLQFPIDNVNDNQVKLSTIDNSVGQTSSSYTIKAVLYTTVYILPPT